MPRKTNKQNASRKAPARPRAKSRRTPSPLRTMLIPAAIIFVFSLLLYGNTLRGEFVWDDQNLIVENSAVRSLDAGTLEKLFFENYWQAKDRLGGYYRPLVSLSYNIDYRLFGMHPAGFHACNIIANAFACVLVFLLIHALFGNAVLAFLTALLFAALPLHTENVAWISGRTDVFATAWMLASLLLYVLARRRGSLALLVCSIGAAAAAFLSKEIAVALPFLVLVVDVICRSRAARTQPAGAPPEGAPPEIRSGRFAWAPGVYALLLVAYLLLRASVIGNATSTYAAAAAGAAGRISLALSILAGYAFKLLYPFNLNAEYDAPVPHGFADLHVLAGILLLAGLIYAAIRCRRRHVWLASIAFFVLGLAPVLNIVPLGEISAERFLYLPSVGFALALGALFARVLGGGAPVAASAGKKTGALVATPAFGRDRIIAMLLFLALLTAYSARTVARNADWRDEDALFAKTVAASGTSARAHLNLGNTYRNSGRIQQAIAEYKKAMELRPGYLEAMSNLAGMYRQQGRIDEAADLLERALRTYPENAELHSNLGALRVGQKRFDEGKKELELAIRYDPGNARARFNLGIVYTMTNDMDKALACFEAVKNKGDEYQMAYYYIGTIEAARGNVTQAKQELERFLQLHRTNDQFKSRAEEILRKAGRPEAAPGP
jgi:tetratricopeptide (TPR) repeat protein